MTDVAQLLESRRSRIGRWAGAAAIVCALHAGGAALAVLHWQEEDFEDAAGALTVEMAPMPAAVPLDTPDLAHGPEQQQAKLTPDASKPAVEEAKKDIPPVDPSPAPEPEVAFPKPQPEAKERPEGQEPQEAAPKHETPRPEAEVPVTTAPPRVEAQPAPSSAPSPGRSASLAREQARWQSSVKGKLDRFKRYPDAASRRGIKGVTIVRFTVDRSGRVVASEVAESSGSPILDEEALALLERASPLPAPPDTISDAFLENFLPVWFGMKPNR